MLTVVYDPSNGFVCPDYHIDDFVERVIKDHERYGHLTIAVGSRNIVNRFRVAAVDKDIKHSDLYFAYQTRTISVDEDGRLSEWPMGFCSYDDVLLKRLSLGDLTPYQKDEK